jgi:hypothetical protein
MIAALALLAIPVKLTVYSTIVESDFGTTATEPIIWRVGKEIHTSRFVQGFVSRTSVDPKNSDLSGVAMEGNGFIEPTLHRDDAELQSFIAQGYRVLTLDEWDEKTKQATFILSKAPLAANGAELIDHVTAAVAKNQPNFPVGRWVKVTSKKLNLNEYRKLDDECSSCEMNHIDLYYGLGVVAPNADMIDDATATLMPEDFEP